MNGVLLNPKDLPALRSVLRAHRAQPIRETPAPAANNAHFLGRGASAPQILFGHPTATWDNGEVILLRPATCDGQSIGSVGGEDDVQVFLRADQSELDIRNYDDGFYTSVTGCELTTSALLYYLAGPAHDVTIGESVVPVSHYVFGAPLMTAQYRPNPSAKKWQARVVWQIGTALAVGAWFNLDGAAYVQGDACS